MHSIEQLTELLNRAKNGDRDAAAGLFNVYAPMVIRRIRGRLGQSMRRVIDSQDVLSTVGRRLDLCVCEGRVQATSVPQFYSFLMGIADRALLEKSRSFGRMRSGEGRYAQLTRLQSAPASPAASEEVGHAVRTLQSPVSRDLVTMQLAGVPHKVIGQLLGISAVAVRQRWRSIRLRLATTLKKHGVR